MFAASDYTVEGKSVLLRGVAVKGADPATFAAVGFKYARDANAVYYEQRRVAGAMPRSFRVIGATGYGADEAAVFYDGQKLAGADPVTFRVLEADFVRDRRGYYLYGRPGTRADYEKALSKKMAELKQHLAAVNRGAVDTQFAEEGHPYTR